MQQRIKCFVRGTRGLLRGMEEGGGLIAGAPMVPVRDVFRRFWPYAKPYRRWLSLILLLVVLAPAIEAATIWMYKVLIDEVLVPRDFGLLGWAMLAYLGLTLAQGFVTFCDQYLSEWVGGRFSVGLRMAFFEHLHGLPLGFFDRRSLGDMISRLSDDVEEIENLVLSGLASSLAYLFQLVFFVGALFYLEWRLALVSLFVVPLFWFAARHFSRKIKRAAREERRRSGSISAVAEESLSNAMLVQAYNREELEISRFRRENEGSFAAQMAATRLSSLFAPLINLIELAGVIVVVAMGAFSRKAHDRWSARLPDISRPALHPDPGLKQPAQLVICGIRGCRKGDRVPRPEAEPTTGLDARSGEKVLAPLRRLMRGRTTIVVSHNLLTVRDATRIVVLEAGRVAEEGTHEEFLERNGNYTRLYHLHRTEEKVVTHKP